MGSQFKHAFAFIHVRHQLHRSCVSSLAGGLVMKVIDLDRHFSTLLSNSIGACRARLTIFLMASQ